MVLFSVTNLFDSGVGSLRQAILNANSTPGADEIQFSSIDGTIILNNGQLNITDSLTINGLSTNTLTVSSNFSSRVFNVDNDSSSLIDVIINGITIKNGYSRSFVEIGGGLFNKENLTLNNSIVSGNSATIGGGVATREGTLTINNSTISGNFADFGAGGVYNGGYFGGSSTTNIINSTISGNFANAVGGIHNGNYGSLTLTNSSISNNSALIFGVGGILNSGTATITNSTISGNSATRSGGGLVNNGTATITNSTISGNLARNGAGIYNNTYFSSRNGTTTVTITNSTVSDNIATNIGGGILNRSLPGYNTTAIITNSTISGNSASIGGGIYNNQIISLTNTIAANNSSGLDCVNKGNIVTNINNLIEDGSCNPLLSGDPNLGPLQDNGGPTFTQALLPSSIAINAGSNAAIPPAILTDQRGLGFPRIINGRVDIGAYEAQTGIPPAPEPSSLFGIVTLALLAIGSVRRRRK